MEPTPVVYLLVPLGLSYGRDVTRGVREYVRTSRPWQVTVAEPTAAALRSLRRQKPGGIIGLFCTDALQRAAKALRIPAVDVSSRLKTRALPRVTPDNIAVGRLAAEHLLQRGFQHFAFAGFDRYYYSQLRRKGFIETIRRLGFTCQVVHEGQELPTLRSLPKPVGLLACDDLRARQIVGACLRIGIRVPEEVAIIGVDNDEALCESAPVPLSSVDPASRRVGFEAGSLLDQLIRGRAIARQHVLVPPAGLQVRASSDVLAVPDSQVAAAMQFMQAHACDPMRVADMMRVLQVSRRTLEKRFRAIFGRTLHDEVRRLQFERASQLLRETDLKIPQVARKCGFGDSKRFTTLFRQEFGSPPTVFRRHSRGTHAAMRA